MTGATCKPTFGGGSEGGKPAKYALSAGAGQEPEPGIGLWASVFFIKITRRAL